ncbi:diadenylate cyclase CdaA [Hufsiella ginkgonis]|uniref:Diadenylate cyclase n=1 Tax=Hufsiella ginkgonis TaxID=2695274 RepID=A0A7K1Y371_9SPHI|nr:diadenylate cyclase CdaA [Hufsiella ginkgonis]MXV17126.1 TIGR00159 family protein [Hufsiella ginkgonis]
MQGLDLSFLHIRLLDVVDIILVAVIMYYVYNLIRGTIAVNILFGLVIIYLAYILVDQLSMRLLSRILGGFVQVGFLALIIVFQQEIRRFLLLIGKNANLKKNTWWTYFFGDKTLKKTNLAYIKATLDACKSMKASRTGALIIFAKYFDEQYYQNSGESMDAHISKRLLESIFQKYSPLHDGAVVITDGKLKCASCILPLTDNENLPLHFGLRHRAGIGISEVSDAVAVIVSEETGEIAYAKQGRVKMNVGYAELERLLNKDA